MAATLAAFAKYHKNDKGIERNLTRLIRSARGSAAAPAPFEPCPRQAAIGGHICAFARAEAG